MQLSTTEKDDLLNGVRNAAVAASAALVALRADISDEKKRKAFCTARKAYHEKLDGFIAEVEKGLDLDYLSVYTPTVYEQVCAKLASAEPVTDAPTPEADIDAMLLDNSEEPEQVSPGQDPGEKTETPSGVLPSDIDGSNI